MKKIVVSGCSFTFEDWNWPKYLAKHFGLELRDITNVGMGSQGNGLISKKLIYAVTKSLEIYKPEEILVGVMWSGIDRFDFHSENNYKSTNWGNNAHVSNIDNPTNVAEDKKWYLINPGWNTLDDPHPLMESHYRYFHSNIGAVVSTLQSILLTQWFLKEKGIKYFMTTYMDIFNKYGKHFLDSTDIKYLYNLIDFDNFLPIEGCFEYVTRNYPQGMPTDGGHHPQPDGHEFFVNNAVVPFLEGKEIIKKNLI